MDEAKTTPQAGEGVDTNAKSSLETMHEHLDSLWISYLTHLDAYTTAQNSLQRHMSAGFISLARANFNARSGVRKYGQDYYHDRAIATKRVAISSDGEERRPMVNVITNSSIQRNSHEESETLVEIEKSGEKDEDVTQLPSPPGTPEPKPAQSASDGDAAQRQEKPPTKTPLESDPLKWFGILLPGALRSSQASFVAAIDETVAEAVNSAKGMRSTEVEIRKLRKEIRKAEKDSTATQN